MTTLVDAVDRPISMIDSNHSNNLSDQVALILLDEQNLPMEPSDDVSV